MCGHKKLFILQSVARRNLNNPHRRHWTQTTDGRKRWTKSEGGGGGGGTKGKGRECGGGRGGVRAFCESGDEGGNLCGVMFLFRGGGGWWMRNVAGAWLRGWLFMECLNYSYPRIPLTRRSGHAVRADNLTIPAQAGSLSLSRIWNERDFGT
jgi:hypothetical protein